MVVSVTLSAVHKLLEALVPLVLVPLALAVMVRIMVAAVVAVIMVAVVVILLPAQEARPLHRAPSSPTLRVCSLVMGRSSLLLRVL
jgi:hypothetical protein